MKARFLFQWATALAMLTAAAVCHADTKPIPLKPGQTLCQRELLVPTYDPDATDEESALIFKVFKNLARDYQCKIRFFKAPIVRQELMYLDGKADILVGDLALPEFEAVGTLVPLTKGPLGFVMLRKPGMPTSAAEVVADRTLRVHYLRSTTPGTFTGWGKEADLLLAPLAKDNRLGSYKDFDEGIKKLRAHHIDALIGTPADIPYIRAFDEALDPVYIPTNLTYVNGWYVSNITAPGVDRELLARLINKYMRATAWLELMNKGIADPKLRVTWAEPSVQ